MIRATLLLVLTAILFITLYIPAVTTPDGFLTVIRAEHLHSVEVWGEDHANAVMSRTLSAHETPQSTAERAVALGISFERASDPLTKPMSKPLKSLTERAFKNEYFRSVEALLVMVTFRLLSLSALLPLALVFAFSCLVDGYVLRLVRAKEFISPSAEAFGVMLGLSIILVGGLVVLFFLPVPLSPVVPVSVLVVAAFALSRAVSEYAVVR